MKRETIATYIFVLLILSVIAICVVCSLKLMNPVVEKTLETTCEDNVEMQNMVINISRLEGVVITLQRMIPVYASLIVAVVLFLTWKQQSIAKVTARDEINDNFQTYKNKIESLKEDAEDMVAKIYAKYETLMQLQDTPLGDIISAYQEKKEEDGKDD